ncbi:MAG: ATP-binding protein [Thermodesulfobacteriota bacterium]|nr:ATP-binding protein [Thermodesulfobacteriota bacterium]
MEHKEIKLVIDSELKNVSLVGRTINGLVSMVSPCDISPHDIELCVVEAVNNCVEHAYGKQRGHEVEVRFALGQDRLVVDVCDTGKPMDQRHLAEADVAMLEIDHDDIDGLAEQGRGLPIIKEIMDAVIYQSKGGKNCLSLTKFFGSGEKTRRCTGGQDGD